MTTTTNERNPRGAGRKPKDPAEKRQRITPLVDPETITVIQGVIQAEAAQGRKVSIGEALDILAAAYRPRRAGR